MAFDTRASGPGTVSLLGQHCVKAIPGKRTMRTDQMCKVGMIALSVMALTGCMPADTGASDSGEPTTAENYVYKGQKDPLMDTSADERAEIMAKRFNMIQARQ